MSLGGAHMLVPVLLVVPFSRAGALVTGSGMKTALKKVDFGSMGHAEMPLSETGRGSNNNASDETILQEHLGIFPKQIVPAKRTGRNRVCS